MRVSILSSVLALCAALVAAQNSPNAFNIPAQGLDVQAGKPLSLSWGNQQGQTVTLKLQYQSGNLTPSSGTILAANVPNTGSTTVNIPSDVSKGFAYTIEIINDQQPDQINFTNNFQVNGATNTASPSAASSTGTMSSSSTSGSSTSSGSSTTGSSSTTSMSSSTSDSTMSTTTSSSSDSSSSSSSSSAAASTSTDSSSASSTSSAAASAVSTTAPGNGAAVKAPAALLAIVAGAAALL